MIIRLGEFPDRRGLSRLFFYVACLSMAWLNFKPLPAGNISDIPLLIAFVIVLPGLWQTITKAPLFLFVGLFCFATGAILSAALMPPLLTGFLVTIKLGLVSIIFYTYARYTLERRHLHTALHLLSIGAAISGIYAILAYYQLVPGIFFMRASGLADHPNHLAITATLASAYPLAMFIHSRQTTLRFLYLLMLYILLAWSILLSLSIAGLLFFILTAIAVPLLYLKMNGIRVGRVYFILFYTIVVLLVSFFSYHQYTKYGMSSVSRSLVMLSGNYERFNSLITAKQRAEMSRDFLKGHIYFDTGASRIETYRDAYDYIKEHPVIGKGIEPRGTKTPSGYTVHNYLLRSWYENGFFGFFGLLIISIGVLVVFFHCFRRKDSLLPVLLVTSTVFFLYAMLSPVLYERFGWIYIVFLLYNYRSFLPEHEETFPGHEST